MAGLATCRPSWRAAEDAGQNKKPA